MISTECREILDFIEQWLAEIEEKAEPFDFEKARTFFKISSRPAEVLAEKTFRANGVLSEWACAPGAGNETQAVDRPGQHPP